MDRLQALRLFLRVVELGSFSKAAADLRIGQPAATKMVAQLEKSLGSRLLFRSTRGVTPTEIGSLYYEKCRLIAHHLDEADSVAALLQSQVQGGLRISTSVAFGRRVMAPLLMRFMALNPKLHIDLCVEDRYVDLVEQGIDVAVRMGPLADSTLGATWLGTNPWVVVASPEYLARRGTPQSPAELGEHDALVYKTVQANARWNFIGPGGHVPVTVRGPLESNNLSALLLAVREGMGIAVLPRYVAHGSLHSGAIVPLLQAWTPPPQDIHAVYPSPQWVPAKVSGFIAWLKDHFGPEWWAASR